MRKIDFVVIGAGIAGLSAANRLARRGSVLVCETEEACGFHASGRSAAFAHFDMDSRLVRALTAASLPLFGRTAARFHPALFIALDGQERKLNSLASDYREWAPRLERLSADEVQRIVPILRTGKGGVVGGLLDKDARKLDAHAMLETHRKSIISAGGEIALRSPIKGLSRQAGRWIVDTPSASYSAKVVINAAGAWVDEIARLASVAPIGIAPLRRTVITFDVVGQQDMRAWPFTKTAGPGFYIEAEGTSRLLACPMDEHPSAPCDAQPEEEDVALTAWRIEQATTLTIPRIASKWAGLRSFAPDREPVVGFDTAAPGFFWLAGQGGFGLQTSPALALAAEAIAAGTDWPEELRAVGVEAGALSPARLD